MTESTNAGSQAPRANNGSSADAGASSNGNAPNTTDDGQNDAANTDEILCQSKDVEKGGSASTRRSHRRKHRPLLRRIIYYIQTTWIGGKFNPKAGENATDTELEELEAPPRYRPDSLKALSTATRFTEDEIKHIYRGFKAECPSGIVREDKFKHIYSQFFPTGANPGLYAHYVFNTFDKEHTGNLSFENFIQGLSILSRGTLEEKLLWTFSLYDINGDGRITREEMTDIVTAIYELMGKGPSEASDSNDDESRRGRSRHHRDSEKKSTEPNIPSADDKIREKVDSIFSKMDSNKDGVVTREEFLECCRRDHNISASMAVFDSMI
ncbi:Kv channel-interacting protein 4-like isoform X1 [Culicoides brevitarsis]|uniref:Kv channel-interacting protein 4-like isoform X1 n=1 Tax=Culicoides brevitarsis TaxID=469753 RepID=UPI00307BC3DA